VCFVANGGGMPNIMYLELFWFAFYYHMSYINAVHKRVKELLKLTGLKRSVL
jgi:hypothetical protein